MFRRILKILFFILVIPGAIITLIFAEGAKINRFWWSQSEEMKINEFHLIQTYHLLGLHESKNSYISTEPLIDKTFESYDELNAVSIEAYPFTLFDKKSNYDGFSIFISDLKISDSNAYLDEDLYYLILEYHFSEKVHKNGQDYAYFEDRPVMVSENKDTYFFFSYLPDFVDNKGKIVEIEKIILYYGNKNQEKQRFLTLSNTLTSDYKDLFSNDDDRYITDFTVENISLSNRVNSEDAETTENIYFDPSLEKAKNKYRHYTYTYMGGYLLISASIAYFLFFHSEVVKTIRYKRSKKELKKDNLKADFKKEYINKGEKKWEEF